MTITEILTHKFTLFPQDIPLNKRSFLINMEDYKQLCTEQKRKVKTFKGVKVNVA